MKLCLLFKLDLPKTVVIGPMTYFMQYLSHLTTKQHAVFTIMLSICSCL